MRKFFAVMFLVVLVACGSSTGPGHRAPDPYIAVRVLDQMDTTTATGRADWRLFALLSGPQVNQNGVSNQGNIAMLERRTHRARQCIQIAADSVGQRFLSILALADTTTEMSTDANATQAGIIAEAWFNGNHALPPHWKAIELTPVDAWQSVQFDEGHGRISDDPIMWDWIWTGQGSTTFAERSDLTDPYCGRITGV